MAEILTHAFVTTKPDSPDPSLVSATEWNDGHVFQGGTNGQILAFDSTQPKSMRWIDGPQYYTGAGGDNGPITVPLSNVAPITFVPTSRVRCMASSVVGITHSTGSGGQIIYVLDGVDIYTSGYISGANTPVSTSFITTPGSHILSVRINGTGTISYAVSSNILVLGIV